MKLVPDKIFLNSEGHLLEVSLEDWMSTYDLFIKYISIVFSISATTRIGQTILNLPENSYNPDTDLLLVVHEGFTLVPDEQYTVEDNTITIEFDTKRNCHVYVLIYKMFGMISDMPLKYAIDTPSITSPESYSYQNMDGYIRYSSTAFKSIGEKQDTHYSSDWQMADGSAFKNIIKEELNQTSYLTHNLMSVPSKYQIEDQFISVRVRYTGASGVKSEWSSPRTVKLSSWLIAPSGRKYKRTSGNSGIIMKYENENGETKYVYVADAKLRTMLPIWDGTSKPSTISGVSYDKDINDLYFAYEDFATAGTDSIINSMFRGNNIGNASNCVKGMISSWGSSVAKAANYVNGKSYNGVRLVIPTIDIALRLACDCAFIDKHDPTTGSYEEYKMSNVNTTGSNRKSILTSSLYDNSYGPVNNYISFYVVQNDISFRNGFYFPYLGGIGSDFWVVPVAMLDSYE